MTRLPSTALIFTTALGMSITGCSPVSNVASAEEAGEEGTLQTLVTTVEGLRGDVQELTTLSARSRTSPVLAEFRPVSLILITGLAIIFLHYLK